MSSKNTKWDFVATNSLEGEKTREEKERYSKKIAKDAMFVKDMKIDKYRYKRNKDKTK